MTIFGKIIKGILVGAGSVLSVIPGLNVVGAAAVTAGLAIGKSNDTVSAATLQMVASVSAGQSSTSASGSILDFLKLYWYVPVGLILLILLILKPGRR
jgi:hypothetical protein